MREGGGGEEPGRGSLYHRESLINSMNLNKLNALHLLIVLLTSPAP